VQITGDYSLCSGCYLTNIIEDATGGIRVNINETNLYLDSRFRLGKDVNIKLKNLYVRSEMEKFN
jgi:hypothetical protein